jgi:proteasome lid subunit RPN8/RPN11
VLFIYDTVLEQIKKDIGKDRPERGGALLGEQGNTIVSKFIFDPTAQTTASTYSPSRRLNQLVKEVEENEGFEYKGIIHSHPGKFDQPSGQDLTELSTGLSLNPHMPHYLVPIVTLNNIDRLEEHELAVGKMKISFFAGYRSDELVSDDPSIEAKYNDVILRKMVVQKIPKGQLTRDMEALCQRKTGLKNPQVFLVNQETQPMLACTLEMEDRFDLLIVVDSHYPACQSSILVTHTNGRQQEFQPDWSDSFIQNMDELINSLIDDGEEARNQEITVNLANAPIRKSSERQRARIFHRFKRQRVRVFKPSRRHRVRNSNVKEEMRFLVETNGTKLITHISRHHFEDTANLSLSKLLLSTNKHHNEEEI